MQKENEDKAGSSIAEVILTWVDDLLEKNSLAGSPIFGLDEWICVGLLWARVAPKSLYAFCEKQHRQNEQQPFLPSDLVLAGIAAQLSEDESSLLDQLVKKHLELTEKLDADETGLLQWTSAPTTYYPAIQASWVWASDQLLSWKLPSEQLEELLLLKDVFVYETDRQLWDNDQKAYHSLPAEASTAAIKLANNALAMLAWIPDQDRAEELLDSYRKQAPPWQSSEIAEEEWLGPAAFLLYAGLKAYEMTQAAGELRSYALKHLPQAAKTAQQECLLWLWRNFVH